MSNLSKKRKREEDQRESQQDEKRRVASGFYKADCHILAKAALYDVDKPVSREDAIRVEGALCRLYYFFNANNINPRQVPSWNQYFNELRRILDKILFNAARTDCYRVLPWLLVLSAGCSISDEEGNNALHIVAFGGDKLTVSLLLWSEQVRTLIDAPNNKHITALMFAAGEGWSVIAQRLLKAGANPNKRAKDGSTALIYAVENLKINRDQEDAYRKYSDVIQRLLNGRANPFLRDNDGWSAIELAEKYGYAALADDMYAQYKTKSPDDREIKASAIVSIKEDERRNSLLAQCNRKEKLAVYTQAACAGELGIMDWVKCDFTGIGEPVDACTYYTAIKYAIENEQNQSVNHIASNLGPIDLQEVLKHAVREAYKNRVALYYDILECLVPFNTDTNKAKEIKKIVDDFRASRALPNVGVFASNAVGEPEQYKTAPTTFTLN